MTALDIALIICGFILGYCVHMPLGLTAAIFKVRAETPMVIDLALGFVGAVVAYAWRTGQL